MKLRNLSIATIILLLIGLGFSSCDDERYRWVRSSLIYDSYTWEPPMELDRYGNLPLIKQDLDIRHIPAHSRGDISNIKLFDSFLVLTASDRFRSGDVVDLILRANGRTFAGRMYLRNYEAIVDIENSKYAAFVEDVLYDLNRNGRVQLEIDVRTNITNDIIAVDFEFNNNLDVEVRD